MEPAASHEMKYIDSLKGHGENISPANNPPQKWGEDSVSQCVTACITMISHHLVRTSAVSQRPDSHVKSVI